MDYYQILQIAPSAPESAIKTAYKQLVRRYHPDTYTPEHCLGLSLAQATERFKQIVTAYRVLGHSESRKRYDKYLERKKCEKLHSTSHRKKQASRWKTDAHVSPRSDAGTHYPNNNASRWWVHDDPDGFTRPPDPPVGMTAAQLLARVTGSENLNLRVWAARTLLHFGEDPMVIKTLALVLPDAPGLLQEAILMVLAGTGNELVVYPVLRVIEQGRTRVMHIAEDYLSSVDRALVESAINRRIRKTRGLSRLRLYRLKERLTKKFVAA